MTRYAILSVALLLGVPAAAQGDAQSAAPAGQSAPDVASPKLKTLLQNCDAHKFETTVESVVNGQPHRSKVKMCGTEGQSDAEWIESLKDAIAKLQSNTEIAASTRDQIVDAINAEIARLQGGAAPAPHSGAALPPPRPAESKPLSDDYSLLPPLPNAAPPPPHVLAPAGEAEPSKVTGTLEAAPSQSLAPPSAAAVPRAAAMANPRLSFSCISADFPSGGSCVTLDRDTILVVKAPQAVAAPLSLRFVRGGETRAELALGTMGRGEELRLQLPRAVCSGVVSSEVQMEIVGAEQVLERQGPYLLHC